MPVILQAQELQDFGMGLFIFFATVVLGGILANAVFRDDQYECVKTPRTLVTAESDMSDEDSGSTTTDDECSST